MRKSDTKLVIALGLLSAIFLVPVTVIGYLNPSFANAPGPQQYITLLGVMFLVGFILFLTRPPTKKKKAVISGNPPSQNV